MCINIYPQDSIIQVGFIASWTILMIPRLFTQKMPHQDFVAFSINNLQVTGSGAKQARALGLVLLRFNWSYGRTAVLLLHWADAYKVGLENGIGDRRPVGCCTVVLTRRSLIMRKSSRRCSELQSAFNVTKRPDMGTVAVVIDDDFAAFITATPAASDWACACFTSWLQYSVSWNLTDAALALKIADSSQFISSVISLTWH